MAIPWSIKHRINTLRARYYLRGALSSLPPLDVAGDNPVAEVHMMLGHHDYNRALAALHTFFHYSGLPDRVGVMLHLDGSIDARGKRWLQDRIPRARFSERPSNDPRLMELFRDRPCCKQYYDRKIGCIQKLFHPGALGQCDRMILIDSDVGFFKPTEVVTAWVDDPTSPPRYILEKPLGVDPDHDIRETFDEVRTHLTSYQGPFDIKSFYFNAGFMMFSKDDLRFDLIEDFLRWREKHARGLNGFWFTEWNVDQTAYMINFAACPSAEPLDDDYVCADAPDKVCNHFLSPHYYKPTSLARLRKALHEVRDKAR